MPNDETNAEDRRKTLQATLDTRQRELREARAIIEKVRADTDPKALAQALTLEIALEQVIAAIEKELKRAERGASMRAHVGA